MNLKRSPFSILNKESREIDYIKGVYKRKIQAEMNPIKIPKMKIREIQSKLKIY